MPPPQEFSFFKCGWEFQIFFGGGNSPPLNTPEQNLLHATAISDRIFQVIFILSYMADQLKNISEIS